VRGLLVKHRLAGLVAVAISLGGCAERGLVSGPSHEPGAGTWLVVTLAAVGIVAVLAGLIVLPASRPGGSVVASWVLGLQAGGVAVAAAILVGAAVRNEQLVRRQDAEQAASLLRLSRFDGADGRFFDLIVVVTVVLAALIVAVLVLAAHCAAGDDPVERIIATGVLATEAAAAAACGVLLVIGFRHAGFVLPTLGLPVLVVAAVAAWPRDDAVEEAPPPGARTA
jgi:hypothetical protein